MNALVFVGDGPIRSGAALLLVIVPGYVLTTLLFPIRASGGTHTQSGTLRSALTDTERAALSFGLSIALLPTFAFVLALLSISFSRTPVMLVFNVFTAVVFVAGLIHRSRSPAGERYTLPLRLGIIRFGELTGVRTRRHRESTGSTYLSLFLVGILGVLVAIWAARFAPADGYEASIYSGTPITFWAGVGTAVVSALFIAISTTYERVRYLAAVLGGSAVTAIVALPVIRGYRFYGYADSLTHLGYAREMLATESMFVELLYPGGHSFATLLTVTGGFEVERAMMIVMLIFCLMYFIFLPLCVWVIVPESKAVTIAAFSGLLLLPINNVGAHLHFHPFTIATLFFPVVLYLVLKHVTSTADEGTVLPSPTSISYGVAGIAILLFHPQTTVAVIALLGSFAVVQLAYRKIRPDHVIYQFQPVYGHFLFILVIFALWTIGDQTFTQNVENITVALQEVLQGSAQTGEVVGDRAQSAQRIQVTLLELFVRLFGVSFLYVLFAASFLTAIILGFLKERRSQTRGVALYFLFSGLSISVIALINFVGNVSSYFFRYLAFGMVLITILGSLGLYFGGKSIRVSGVVKPIAVTIGLLVMVAAVATAFSSPYIYLPNQQVSEYNMEGYDSTFDVKTEGSGLAGIRTGGGRYSDGLDADLPRNREWVVPNAVLQKNLTTYRGYRGFERYDRDYYYLSVTRTDRQRELVAYRSVRYSEAGLQAPRTTPGVSRVLTNGNFRLYYVERSPTADAGA